ncbi:hypothetical protein JVU11DRAFT_1046 [Chiua virens]|nr:hypothetical protein JVU11DRAFT_1046 [Chiua virens]
MISGLAEVASANEAISHWLSGFRQQCAKKLEELGDIAIHSNKFDDAIGYFSTILLLDPVDRSAILIKRSIARARMNSWEDALVDADEIIRLNPSSHKGYEGRHAALHVARRHVEAVEAFDTMLSKLEASSDERVRELRNRYTDPRLTIRHIVDQTLRHMPRVLIDTTTGRLCDKKQQADVFYALPIYHELLSSVATESDHTRIQSEVKNFYRYVMLSHTWESEEPLLQKVEHTTVYELEASPTHIKLQRFCSLVRSLDFRWAWSDTCCVDKVNHVVLQESLIAMFTWYRGSSLTVVYLRDVSSQSSQFGDINLRGSLWNTRGWTYQEYVASETIQFYTGDWKPYLGLALPNHKESPIIISEMEVPGISAQESALIRPGLERVREKLFLAANRQTTLMEDIAYSLFGIFDAAIPVMYGEGNRAVGRLLEHVLTGSGDVTILAWTGRAGSYNSCLPSDLTAYIPLIPPHVPPLIDIIEMDHIVAESRSSDDVSLAMTLYDRLEELPTPSLAASRLRLSGIVFCLTNLVPVSGPNPETKYRVYRATSSALMELTIKTLDDLTGMKDLCLVNPWIRPLLDQEFSKDTGALDKATQALRLVARLRQTFGALLFIPISRVEHRRVAADALIMVQLRKNISLTALMDNIRTIEVR